MASGYNARSTSSIGFFKRWEWTCYSKRELSVARLIRAMKEIETVGSNTPHHIPESSSSRPMVESVRFEPVMALGRKLVSTLGVEERIDTLSRWMAHWIADLMQSVENSAGDERAQRASACADAIMKLWAHRNVLPSGKRPFESLEPVLRALESLDPDADRFRYSDLLSEVRRPGKETASEDWLNRARAVDRAARALVKHCVTVASNAAVEGEDEWIALAKSGMTDEDVDLDVIMKLLGRMKPSEAEELEAEGRSRVKSRIEDLEALISLAQSAIAELGCSTGSTG